MKTKIQLLLFSILMFVSCENKSKHHTATPQNLPVYFQALIDSGKTVPNFMEDTTRVAAVVRSFAPLQEYAEGKRTDYPAEEIQKAIGSMLENFAYFDNMEMCEEETCETTETNEYAFFEKYLEQVFRLCPDANLLCKWVSDDGKMGYFDIYSFPSIYYYPNFGRSVFPHIIYRTEHGFSPVHMVFLL